MHGRFPIAVGTELQQLKMILNKDWILRLIKPMRIAIIVTMTPQMRQDVGRTTVLVSE